MPCLTLLSFEKIGSAIKDIKDLNNLSSDQRNMKNDLFGGLVTEIAKNKDGLSIDEQINKMQKSKLNPAVINDAMTLAVNQPESSFENKGNEVSEALRKHDISASFESINNSADSATEAMKRFNNNANLEKAEKSTTSFASKFKTHVGGGVEKVHTKFSNGITKTKAKLGELKTSLSNIGTGLKETMVANLPTVLLAAGTAAAAGVNALANNIRSRALNAGTKNLDKYNKKINKSQNKLDSVNDIKAEFNRLAKGVDNTTNQNVGLSESDYSRYLELKKQLVKTNKDLVKSMDSEGNAIIDNNSAIDKSIKKYERQIQKNKQAIASKKNLAIQNKAAALNMNKTTEGNRVGDRSLTGNVGRLLTGGKKGVGIGGALIGGAIGTLIAPGAGTAIGAVIGNGVQAAANLGGQLLLGTKDSGAIHSIFASKKSIQSDGLNSNKSNLISMIKNTKAYKKEAKSILGKNADLDNLTDQQLSTLLNNANFDGGGFFGVKDNTISKYADATKDGLKQVQDYLKEFKSTTLENTLEASQGFATLDKTSQEFAKNYVSNMDLSSDKMSGEGATKYLEEQEQKVRSFTSKLATDSSLKDAYEKFSDIKGDTSKNATEWQQEINKQFKALKDKTGLSNKELSGALGISLSGDDVLTSDGRNVNKMIDKLTSEFSSKGKNYFKNLGLDQLSDAYDLITDKNEIFTGSLDQLKKRLDTLTKYKNSGESFSLETYQKAVDSADDDAHYNTFVSGLKSAKEEYDAGKVGTDQFKQMAGLISPTGKTDDKNFKENYDHIMKYFTSDDSGPKAFVSQLQNMTNASGEAMATLNKKTGDYKVNIDNTAKAAKKMGMGLVPFESMLDNLKTYGWKVDYSSLTEQWDDASTKLNEWSQIWEKNGGSLGDSQGKEIENYKQKLEEFRKEGEKLPDNWEKTLTIKVNAAEATTKLTNAVDDYKQKLEDNGDSWAKSSEAKKDREEIFASGSSSTRKAKDAQEATMDEDGLKHNQKYKDEYDKKTSAVKSVKEQADKTGSAKDMDAYQQAVQDRNDLIGKGATDEKYYVKTQFKNRNEVNKELKRNGATVDKDGNVTAGKDNKKDIQTIIDSYNKGKKSDQQIKVTWADGKAPKKDEKSESSTKKAKDDSSTKSEKPKKQEKSESSEKGNKSPSLLDKINNWIKDRQTKETKGDYKKPSEGSGKKTGDTDKKYESVKSWFKSIPSNLNGLFKNAQTKQTSTSYQRPKVQGTQSWQTDNTKYNKAVSSAKKFGGDVVSGAKNIGSSALSGAKSILGSIGNGIKGLFGGSKSSASASASKKQSSKSDVKVNVKGNAKKTIDSIKKSLSSMKSKSISIKVKGNAKKTISSISKSLKKLKSKSISIKAKGNASSVIKKIASALKKLKNKTITAKVKDSASHKISSIKGKLNALGKMHPTPKVTINTSGLPAVEAAKSAINGLHDKSVNVSVNYSQSGKPSKAYGTFARGTMAWSTAYARGTANALAGGNIGAKTSGKTLVGELGVEAIIPKNSQRMFLLGTTGPEFADIHSGDIVFNHQQTADLLANGHTSTRAKVQGGMSAFAHGTSFKALSSGQSATASGGWRGGIAKKSRSSSTKKHTSSTKRNTKATDRNTSSKKKNTKATNKNTKKKLALAKLIDSVGKQFDFIAIKLDRASAATEKFANMINDYVKSDTKTKALWNQYKSVGTEISTNKKAASKYKSEASSFASKAIKKAPKTKSTSKKKNQAKLKKYFARVRSGSININTISNDNMRSAVEHYQELYEKYLQANQAAQQLKNTQRELFNQWLNMPIEKAQKAIDNRANIYNYYSARGSAASTGESGVNALRGVYGDEVEANEKNVKSKTSTRDKAKRSDDAANKNLKKAKSTQTKAKKTKTSKAKSAKKAIKSQKGLSRSKKKSLNSKISKGQKISTKGLKGKTKKKAQEYNASVDAKKKADKNVKSKQSTKNKTSKNLKTAQSNLNKAKSEYKAAQALQNETVTAAKADLPAYSYQNDILKKQVELKEADYKNQREAQKTAQKNYDKYQKELNSAKSAKTKAQKKTKDKSSTVKKKGKKILSRKSAKKLTGTQKKLIKSGKKVSTKGVTNKKLLRQLKDYNKAVEAKNKAKKAEAAASKKVTSASIKERDAQNALTTADHNAKQAAAELAQEKVNAAMQSQANIKAYYDAKQNYESIQGNNASSAAKLKQAKGEDLITEDYQKQIDSNEKQAQLYEESAKTMQLNLDEKVKAGDIKKGSQEWMQMQGEIDACTSSANDLRTTNEELKNSMRDDIYYRGFERAIKAAQNLQNALTTISSLIDEDAMFDDDGNLTDYGTAAIATNIANVKSEKEELNQLMQERAKMAEHRDEYSDTEWADAIQKSDQDIADAVKSIKSAEDSVTTILKNNAKQKLDAINKTISAYSEAIKKSNDYYTYDKQLKSSNKDIQILRSQINALNGVSDAASRAKKARLEAELQEKQDALDDTVKDHIYNLQIDGLDKLSTQLNDDYEKYCKELSSSVDKIEKTFTSLSGTISSEGTKIDSTITTILGHYGVKPSDLGLTDSKVTGYAQGGLVKSVHKNGDDGLASLAVGEEVATVDVVNLANKIRQDKVLNALANGHTLNGMTMDGIGTTEINVNFGEAIGAINVPSGVSEEELQRIVNESYKYTSQKVTRDMAKIVGRKRPV
nr:MAG TPA: hypothetical protein [Caudoviricetes sp.]